MITKHMGRAVPEASEFNAYEAIRAAQIVIAKQSEPAAVRAKMLSSGVVACEDASKCFNRGDFRSARDRALDSLAYTVGVFSGIYQSAADRGPCR
jgi:hypothetical protein